MVGDYWAGFIQLFEGSTGFVFQDDKCSTFKDALMLGMVRAVEAHEGWQLMEAHDASN